LKLFPPLIIFFVFWVSFNSENILTGIPNSYKSYTSKILIWWKILRFDHFHFFLNNYIYNQFTLTRTNLFVLLKKGTYTVNLLGNKLDLGHLKMPYLYTEEIHYCWVAMLTYFSLKNNSTALKDRSFNIC